MSLHVNEVRALTDESRSLDRVFSFVDFRIGPMTRAPFCESAGNEIHSQESIQNFQNVGSRRLNSVRVSPKNFFRGEFHSDFSF